MQLKNLIKRLSGIIIVSTIPIAGTIGCASTSGHSLLTETITPTNVVQQVQTIFQTNVIVQTNLVTVTNGVDVTNTVNEVVPILETNTSYVTNLVNLTNYAVSSLASNVLGAAGVVNTVTGPINPFSGTIAAVLGLATAGLGWYAKLKKQQAQQHLSTASTIITAVEGLTPAVGDAVKAAVQAQALKMGTTATVNATVQAVTNNLPVGNVAPAPAANAS